jgi:hypothetical protein
MEPAVSSEPLNCRSRWKVGDWVRPLHGHKKGHVGEVVGHDSRGTATVALGSDVIPFIDEWLEAGTKPNTGPPVSPKSHWKPGDRVRVLDGSRKGQFAEVKGFDAYGHAVVAFEDGDSSPYLDFWLKAASDVPDRPGVADTLEGIAAWQREAPMDRDVLIHLKGHTVTATASLLAGSTEAFSGKFLSDYTPEAAFACMDAIVMQRSRVPIVFGARPEPPLGDVPYCAGGD